MTELVSIERIAAGGDGVARLADGRVAFVPRSAPGDRAWVTIGRADKRFVRARIERLEAPGPGRVDPICPHYDRDQCGGCQLQHLEPAAQATARRGILADALERIARQPVDVPPIEAAPLQWEYRTKISLAVGPGAIGYHRLGQAGSIVSLERCWLAAKPVDGLWQRLRATRSHLPPQTRRVVCRLDRSGGEHLIVETGPGRPWQDARRLWNALVGANPLTIWWQPAEGAARAVAGASSSYPAAAFEQVHPAMGETVRAVAVAALGDLTGAVTWDLYAGVGDASALMLAGGARRVVSVERDRRAVEEAERRGPAEVERIAGQVERVIGSLPRADAVYLNPPRVGMAAAAVDGVRAAAPSRLVYVSCDPATLARDLGRFGAPTGSLARYRLVSARGFDLFPQTAHLETVAVLERA
ncbi:MAG: class I SAM-dependent RNA methyltransferase [Gemmatimonadetes bacterium]|nr:class I SAM-dependent RNA methyltransferase [Gemmatimonadota bacterium]